MSTHQWNHENLIESASLDRDRKKVDPDTLLVLDEDGVPITDHALGRQSPHQAQLPNANPWKPSFGLRFLRWIQGILDILGLIPIPPITLFADGLNGIIYLLRAIYARIHHDHDQAKQYLIDAGISLLAIIPHFELIKLLRLRKLARLTNYESTIKETLRNYTHLEKLKRIDKNSPKSDS